MAFYIRKAFKTGPVRLNLSKGGLGLSAGVTGARAGINSRGTYVHGGRHGLYYRKYARQENKKRRGRGKSGATGGQDQSRGGKPPGLSTHAPVDLFRDTGVTFSSRTPELSQLSPKEFELPSATLFTTPVKASLGASAVLLVVSLFTGTLWVAVVALLLATGTASWLVRDGSWKHKAEQRLQEIVTKTESKRKLPEDLAFSDPNPPKRWQHWLALHLHAVVGELAMRQEEIDTLSTLRALDEQVPADKSDTDRIRASILGKLLDEMLEDHLLSEEEEQAVGRLIEQLELPEALIDRERERLKHYSQIRREIERPLEEIDPGIPLVRGEKAYEQFDDTRLLNERVLNRFQRDKVQYRELGYEIDLEGKLTLTDRRMLFAGRGSREYRVNRVLDITADPESGIVELTMSGRKSPVLVTVPKPMVLAARMEKVVEAVA